MPPFARPTLRVVATAILLIVSLGLTPRLAAGQERPPGEMSDEELTALVQKAIGKKPRVLRSQRFRVITVFDPDEARRLLELAEKAHAAISGLFCVEPGRRFWAGTMDEFRVAEKQFPALVRDVMSRYESDQRVRRTTLFWRDGVSVTGAAGFRTGGQANDTIVHHVAEVVLMRFGGKTARFPVWLRSGLGHWLTNELSGTMSVRQDRGPRWGKPGLPTDPQAWRERVNQAAADETHHRFDTIKYRLATDFWEDDQVQAWAFVTYLMSEHRAKFSRLLHRSRSTNWERAYYDEFHWTGREFDRHWLAWVKSGGMKRAHVNRKSRAERSADDVLATRIEEKLGEKPTLARSEHFRLSLLSWGDRAQDWVKRAERVHADYVRLVGDPPRIPTSPRRSVMTTPAYLPRIVNNAQSGFLEPSAWIDMLNIIIVLLLMRGRREFAHDEGTKRP